MLCGEYRMHVRTASVLNSICGYIGSPLFLSLLEVVSIVGDLRCRIVNVYSLAVTVCSASFNIPKLYILSTVC